MYSVEGTDVHEHSRPKGKIVGKNNHEGNCRTFRELSDGRLAVGYSAKYAGQANLTVVYQLPAFEEVGKLDGLGDRIDVHHRRALLLGDAADESNLAKFGKGISSCDPLQLVDVAALRGPSTWIQGDEHGPVEFICCVNNWMQVEKVNSANDYLLPLFQQQQEYHRPLVRINHHAKPVTLIHNFNVGPDDSVCHLVLSQYGDTIYFSTQRKVGALHFETGEIKWQRELAREPTNVYDVFHIYGFDLSHDQRFLAAGGIAADEFADNEFVILDASSGQIVFQTALCRRLADTPVMNQKSSIHAIRWHPSGWCAVGTAAGIMAHVTIDGTFRTYKGAGKGIKAITFIDEGKTLLVGSVEKQFRTWGLLADEVGK